MFKIYQEFAAGLTATPQNQPIPGREVVMEKNDAGGYGFKISIWERLYRFLIFGSEGGTMYIGEQQLTAENATNAIACIKEDGSHALTMAMEVNINGRAAKVNSQLFVLALGLHFGDEKTRLHAENMACHMLRTGSHVLMLAAMLRSFGCFGRRKRRVFSTWFNRQSPDDVAYQIVKYRNRYGWKMRDLLRVVHPKPASDLHDTVYRWAVGKSIDDRNVPGALGHYLLMLSEIEEGLNPVTILRHCNRVPREALPSEWLNMPDVIREMLPEMPMHAMIRNLGQMTKAGLIGPDTKDREARYLIVRKLGHANSLRKSRLHPLSILLATIVYAGGSGIRGSGTWKPDRHVLGALQRAYEASFSNVSPTNRKILVAIDISSSMNAMCMGTQIAAAQAAMAFGVTLVRAESEARLVLFNTSVVREVPVTALTSPFDPVPPFGGTDLSAPVREAPDGLDAIVILTDNETWAGRQHCSQAIHAYRQRNPRTKLVVAAMAANRANVVDPEDDLSLGICGLDASVMPMVMEFISPGH